VSDELRAVAAACARLDVLASFAHTALTEAYTRPTIISAAPAAAAAGKLTQRRMSSVSPDGADYDLPSDGRTGAGELVAVEARHPVVERAMALVQRSFVPNSVMLGAHAADGLAFLSGAEHGLEHSTRAALRPRTTLAIVTGPNASGKSCFLRTAALLQILAQAGSFVVRRGTLGTLSYSSEGYSGYSIVQLTARRGTLGTLSYSSWLGGVLWVLYRTARTRSAQADRSIRRGPQRPPWARRGGRACVSESQC
jgi:hypothetical protein